MRSILITLLACASLGAQTIVPLAVGGDYAAQFESWLKSQAELHWDKREREIQRLSSAAQIRARQEYIRKTMVELIGGLPSKKSPLNSRVTGMFERDGYRVENVIFESLPGFRVTANLYLPTQGKAPYPAVLGVAGHSLNGKASATYQAAFIGFARQGYAVLAFDPPGQGERLEYFDADSGRSRPGIGVPEHNMAGLQCLLTGHTFARYEVWDGIRAFDYLLTRPEIDPQRISVAGNSGGGTQAAYLAVFDPRLAAVVSSCYMTRWRELWSGPGPQDAEQIFPGFIEKGLDFGDFALAQAPRPFIMTTAIRDFFPIDGARATFRQNQRLFDMLGNGEKAGYFEFDDTHGWSKPRREAAYRFLGKWLQGRETDGVEPSILTEEESLLYATPTGQVATSGGSETVRSLNLKEARILASARGKVTADTLRAAIGLRGLPGVPAARGIGEETRDGVRIEKLELTVESDVKIPALLFHPASTSNSGRATVFASSFGKGADPDILELAKSGSIVLAVDPRGMGESYGPAGRSGYSQAYQLASRAILLGRNLVEMQVSDLLSAARYLRGRPEARDKKLVLYAKGSVGPAAAMAAALDPQVTEMVSERSVVSYMDVAAAQIHDGLNNIVVPGIFDKLDLPEVLLLMGSRRATLVSPAHPNGRPMLMSEAQRSLGAASSAVHVLRRGEGWSLRRTLPHWAYSPAE